MASHKEEQINTTKKKMCSCQKKVSCLFTTAADKDFEPGILNPELLVGSSNFPGTPQLETLAFQVYCSKATQPHCWSSYSLGYLFSYLYPNSYFFPT